MDAPAACTNSGNGSNAQQQTSEILELFVPGRVCLFGEHSDWAGQMRTLNPDIIPGQTIVVGTQQGLYARVKRLRTPVLHMKACDDRGKQYEISLQMDATTLVAGAVLHITEYKELSHLKTAPDCYLQMLFGGCRSAEARKGGFWSYVAGTAYWLLIEHEVGGVEIDNFKTTLPLRKGLSSSAAVCVLVASAFNRLFDLKLTTRGLMEYAYRGEILTPSHCGRMDQACAFGANPVCITYDADLLHVESITLSAQFYIVLVDLKADKDTTAILHALQSAYPHPVTDEHKRLHALLGEINQSFCQAALRALEQGDAAALGRLMTQSQLEFDSRAAGFCPEQLTAPKMHSVLSHAAIQEHVWGGKGVGSQGDGTVQFVCKDAASQSEVVRLLERDCEVHCIPMTLGSAAQH